MKEFIVFKQSFKYILKYLTVFSVYLILCVSCQTSPYQDNLRSQVSTKNSKFESSNSKEVSKQDDYFFKQGNEYILDGLFREAITSYKQALDINPDHHQARRNLGIAQLKSKLYKPAQKNLSLIESRFEKDFDTHYFLAEAYRANDNYSKAIFQYQKALSIKPEDPRALKSLSWSFYNIKYYSEALKTAKKLYKLYPQDSQVIIILSRIFIKTSKLELALKLINKAQLQASKESLPFYLSVQGDIYAAMKKYPQAINTYKKALYQQPLLPGSLLGLGECMLITKQDKNKAIGYIERSLRIRPQTTEAYYLLGKAYEDIDSAKSKKYYDRFKRMAAKDPEFLARLSEMESGTKDQTKPEVNISNSGEKSKSDSEYKN